MKVISRVHLYEGGNHYAPGAEVHGLSRDRAEHLESLGLVRIERELEPEPEPGREQDAEHEPDPGEASEDEPEPGAQVAALEEPPQHRAVRRRRRKG